MSMSTPVHQLPQTTATPSSTAPPMDDPEVLSMLNEMETEVQEATKQQHAVRAPPMPQPMAHAHVTPPPAPVIKKTSPKGIWNMEVAQKAAIYAVIAAILFYPSTMQFIYSKLPKFESIFSSYDVIIRTILLIVVIYFAMMYLPL